MRGKDVRFVIFQEACFKSKKYRDRPITGSIETLIFRSNLMPCYSRKDDSFQVLLRDWIKGANEALEIAYILGVWIRRNSKWI